VTFLDGFFFLMTSTAFFLQTMEHKYIFGPLTKLYNLAKRMKYYFTEKEIMDMAHTMNAEISLQEFKQYLENALNLHIIKCKNTQSRNTNKNSSIAPLYCRTPIASNNTLEQIKIKAEQCRSGDRTLFSPMTSNIIPYIDIVNEELSQKFRRSLWYLRSMADFVDDRNAEIKKSMTIGIPCAKYLNKCVYNKKFVQKVVQRTKDNLVPQEADITAEEMYAEFVINIRTNNDNMCVQSFLLYFVYIFYL